MISANFLFEAALDWRRWHGQRVKYATLVVGSALVCAVLALAFRFAELLFFEPPPWVHRQANFFTLGREPDSGGFTTIDRQSIEKLHAIPGVEDTTYLAFRTLDLSILNQPTQAREVAYFAANFPHFAQARFPGLDQQMDQDRSHTLAWISHRLFVDEFDSDPAVIGRAIRDAKIDRPFTIAGVLSSAMDRIGTHQPEVWLDARNLRFHTPFVMPSSGQATPQQEQMVDRFLTAAPLYYGLFTVDRQPVGADTLLDRLRLIDSGSSHTSFIDDGAQPQIISGITLNPLGKAQLKRQWLNLLVFVAGLGIVVALNAITVFTGRMILHQQDYVIVRMLGASPANFLRSALAGLLPMAAAIAILALLISTGLVVVIKNSASYVEFAGGQVLFIEPWQGLSALVLVVLILAGCVCLPTVRFAREPLFNRAMGASRKPWEQALTQANLTIQLTTALIALYITGTLFLQELRKFQHIAVDRSVQVIEVSARQIGNFPAEIHTGRFPGLGEIEVAAAAQGFHTASSTQTITHPEHLQEITVNTAYVSDNYFSVLGIATKVSSVLWPDGVILNEAAATRLVPPEQIESLIGSRVSILGLFSQSARIAAIVANSPHLGLGNENYPYIYLPLHDLPVGSSMAFFFSAADRAIATPRIRRWAETERINPKIIGPTAIGDSLAALNAARSNLFYSSTLIAIIIGLSVFISLAYQVKARLAMTRHEYGVILAIGAPWSALYRKAGRVVFTATLIAVPLTLATLLAIKASGGTQLALHQFEPKAFVSVSGLVLSMAITAVWWPTRTLVRQPIFQVLKRERN